MSKKIYTGREKAVYTAKLFPLLIVMCVNCKTKEAKKLCRNFLVNYKLGDIYCSVYDSADARNENCFQSSLHHHTRSALPTNKKTMQ